MRKKRFALMIVAALCMLILYGCGGETSTYDVVNIEAEMSAPEVDVDANVESSDEQGQGIVTLEATAISTTPEIITLGIPIANPDVDVSTLSDAEYFQRMNEVIENFDYYEGKTIIIMGNYHEHGGFGGFYTIFHSVVRNDLSC